jgi:hypothetical protein
VCLLVSVLFGGRVTATQCAVWDRYVLQGESQRTFGAVVPVTSLTTPFQETAVYAFESEKDVLGTTSLVFRLQTNPDTPAGTILPSFGAFIVTPQGGATVFSTQAMFFATELGTTGVESQAFQFESSSTLTTRPDTDDILYASSKIEFKEWPPTAVAGTILMTNHDVPQWDSGTPVTSGQFSRAPSYNAAVAPTGGGIGIMTAWGYSGIGGTGVCIFGLSSFLNCKTSGGDRFNSLPLHVILMRRSPASNAVSGVAYRYKPGGTSPTQPGHFRISQGDFAGTPIQDDGPIPGTHSTNLRRMDPVSPDR